MCKKYTKSKNLRVVGMKDKRIMLLSNCAVITVKKLRFIKEQEISGIIGSLDNTLSKIPLIGRFVLGVLTLSYKI